MPRKPVTSMEELNRFVMLAHSGHFRVADLCE